ncbi:MAG: hypothetical protein O3A20_05290 [Planctomycetota bacterium]|nr:hypothetical protein [Planctomycetota bacterium]
MGESVPPVEPAALQARAAVLLGPAAARLLASAGGSVSWTGAHAPKSAPF